MALFDGLNFQIVEQGLDASWYQQKVINHNIANIDTPDYKAKTFSFGLVLDNALHAHIAENKSRLALRAGTYYETGTVQTLNGNNVDIEKESNALLDAQYQYDTMIDYLNSQYQMIRTAIGK